MRARFSIGLLALAAFSCLVEPAHAAPPPDRTEHFTVASTEPTCTSCHQDLQLVLQNQRTELAELNAVKHQPDREVQRAPAEDAALHTYRTGTTGTITTRPAEASFCPTCGGGGIYPAVGDLSRPQQVALLLAFIAIVGLVALAHRRRKGAAHIHGSVN